MARLQRKIIKDIRSKLIQLMQENIILDCSIPKTGECPKKVYHTENFQLIKDGEKYIKNFKEMLENKEFLCLFEDLGMIQGFYELSNDGEKLIKASLIFYPNPGLQLDEEIVDREIAEKINEYSMSIVHSRYLRFDFDSGDAHKEIYHPLAHMHTGFDSKCRIALDKFPFFSEFLIFVLFLNYPSKWKKWVSSEEEIDFDKYMKKRIKNLSENYIPIDLTECEKSHYHLKI